MRVLKVPVQMVTGHRRLVSREGLQEEEDKRTVLQKVWSSLPSRRYKGAHIYYWQSSLWVTPQLGTNWSMCWVHC